MSKVHAVCGLTHPPAVTRETGRPSRRGVSRFAGDGVSYVGVPAAYVARRNAV